MDTVILGDGIEEVGEEIQILLQEQLSAKVTEMNTLKDDSIELTAPETTSIKLDSPSSGSTLADIGEFPLIYINPVKKRGMGDLQAFQFTITGFYREDDGEDLVVKNMRFAETVEAVLKMDFNLSGKTGGAVLGDIDYYDPIIDDAFYSAFQIDISYLV